MSAESMAEYYDAAEQFESSSDESEVCTQKTYWCTCVYAGVSTRGNKYTLDNYTFHCNIRKYLFSPRIVNIYNE